MNQSQKKINNLCIDLNRKNHLSLSNIVEIDPDNIQQTILFSKWFKMVLCIKEFEEWQLEFYEDQLSGIKNVLLLNADPIEALNRFKKDEFIDYIFFNKGIYIDYNNKLYDNGLMIGNGKISILKDVRYNKNYWIAKKQ